MADYTIISELGRGGMGVVYRARQEPLGREVAVKFLLADYSDHPLAAKRFHREVMACTQLNHPHIIKILDSGEEKGRHYYVMEYLGDAVPLDRLIKDQGPFPPARAVSLAIQLLEALEYVHGRNFVHRDLKPPNVMVRPGDHAVLMDFGLARDLGASTMLTEEGAALGTPRFIPPEMFRGQECTAQADLWAVGATLYEMLTKTRAFTGKTYAEIATCVMHTEPPPLSSLVPALPADLDQVVRRFLKKDPAERVPTARKGIRLLKDWLGEPPDEVAPRRSSRKVLVSRVTEPPPPPARPRAGAVAAGAALIGLAGAFMFIHSSKDNPVAASPQPSPSATAAPEASSAKLEEAAARVRRALERLEPARLIADLAHDLRPSSLIHSAAARQQRWEPDRARWQEKLRARFAAEHLAEEVDAFEPMKDRAYASPGVSAAAKLALYAAVALERELEEEARSAQLEVPRLAARLASREYGPGASPSPGAPSVCLSLVDGVAAIGELAPEKPLRLAVAANIPQDHFFDYGDSALADQVGHSSYAHAGPLVLGGPLARIRAAIDTTHPENAFRVLFARQRPASPKDYRLLAVLTPESYAPQKLCHAVPAGLVEAGPLFVRVELAASPRSRRIRADQDGRLRWLQLSW